MRHGKTINHLGRTAPHRKAMLSNMASSLILHKRITTTVAKAKALRKYVEPLITKSKTDTTHSRRVVFSYLQDKDTVRELFDEISEKISQRPGGYTRIIKTGSRLGDNAEMCVMELVDYNELLLGDTTEQKSKTRRGARRGKKGEAPVAAVADKKQEKKADKAVEEAGDKEEVAVISEDVVEVVTDEEIVGKVIAEEVQEADDTVAPLAEAGSAEVEGSSEEDPENAENKDKEDKAG